MEIGITLRATGKKSIAINRILMDPDTYHTIFLVFDRPPAGKIGQSFDIEIRQMDAKRERVIGGLTAR